jgi:oxygen-dependent protoporphyrinogen oxidase
MKEVEVLEAEDRPGGKIRTERVGGFLCEWGVNGFLDNRPKTLELSKNLSLTPLRSSDAARKRYIYLGGRLRLLPENPKAFLKSDVLSPLGKLRIALEPFIPRNTDPHESLASFAMRRLGREAYENLIDPMASGVFAGDPERMNVLSCFPKVKNVENRYGSLIKGMIKLSREAKKSGRGSVGAGPGGTLTSFQGGMEDMVIALRGALRDSVRLKSRAVGLERLKGGYRVHLADGTSLETETVVLACPAYETALITKGFDKAIHAAVADVPYPALAVISLGYRAEKVPARTDCFGFLVPGKEGRKILGTLFDSSIFPVRAPQGHVLLRIMIGGARASDLAMKEEGAILRTALDEMRDILGIKAEPDFHRVFRHERAIPQYAIDHPERLERVDSALVRHPGLFITGNAYRGVALNDCIENSEALAEKIIEYEGGVS